MGTTRIKVIDLSSDKKGVKTSRKQARPEAKRAHLAAKQAEKTASLPRGEASSPSADKGTEVKGAEIKKTADSKINIIESDSTSVSKPSKSSQPSKPSPSSRRHLGTKYLSAAQLVEKGKLYPVNEAVDLLYKTSITKFDPTVEAHLNVFDKNIKGTINLPHMVQSKKQTRYLVFADKKVDEDKLPVETAKNIIWGDAATIADIEGAKLKPKRDFDTVIAHPKFMPQIAGIAKILGPAGLMPNSKNKTVSENIEEAIKGSAASGVSYKTDGQAPIIHTTLGKLSAKREDIEENLKAFILAIGPSKIKKATVATTMGPGIKVDVVSPS